MLLNMMPFHYQDSLLTGVYQGPAICFCFSLEGIKGPLLEELWSIIPLSRNCLRRAWSQTCSVRSGPGLRACGGGRDSRYLGAGGWCVGSTFSPRDWGVSQRVRASLAMSGKPEMCLVVNLELVTQMILILREIWCIWFGEAYWKRKQKFSPNAQE